MISKSSLNAFRIFFFAHLSLPFGPNELATEKQKQKPSTMENNELAKRVVERHWLTSLLMHHGRARTPVNETFLSGQKRRPGDSTLDSNCDSSRKRDRIMKTTTTTTTGNQEV